VQLGIGTALATPPLPSPFVDDSVLRTRAVDASLSPARSSNVVTLNTVAPTPDRPSNSVADVVSVPVVGPTLSHVEEMRTAVQAYSTQTHTCATN
jgi:hypothetical protein